MVHAQASGGFVRNIQVYIDNDNVFDSGDLTGQALASADRSVDLQPNAGAHALRVTATSTGGAEATKTGTMTITTGGCSVRLS
jgi:hypothetical protein